MVGAIKTEPSLDIHASPRAAYRLADGEKWTSPTKRTCEVLTREEKDSIAMPRRRGATTQSTATDHINPRSTMDFHRDLTKPEVAFANRSSGGCPAACHCQPTNHSDGTIRLVEHSRRGPKRQATPYRRLARSDMGSRISLEEFRALEQKDRHDDTLNKEMTPKGVAAFAR